MIAMLFEYNIARDHMEEYIREAADLRPYLQDIDGFISIERFESTSEPGKMLSVGFFAHEEAVIAWRNAPAHRRVQAMGRKRLFTKYRLRMAKIIRDYSEKNREQAPKDSSQHHDKIGI
ncbi:MAG: antibiotic biosynthesis monooxygenase [Robiginitomaculum sp.]|nr:antibiotic biosynthesis monooxygenase [Robiginitomaculum sp.]